MEIKKYNYGDGYFQKLFIEKNKIMDAKCECKWAQNNQNAWKEGNTLCWHLVCVLKEHYLEVRNGKNRKD